jgi:hypothetical protein
LILFPLAAVVVMALLLAPASPAAGPPTIVHTTLAEQLFLQGCSGTTLVGVKTSRETLALEGVGTNGELVLREIEHAEIVVDVLPPGSTEFEPPIGTYAGRGQFIFAQSSASRDQFTLVYSVMLTRTSGSIPEHVRIHAAQHVTVTDGVPVDRGTDYTVRCS